MIVFFDKNTGELTRTVFGRISNVDTLLADSINEDCFWYEGDQPLDNMYVDIQSGTLMPEPVIEILYAGQVVLNGGFIRAQSGDIVQVNYILDGQVDTTVQIDAQGNANLPVICPFYSVVDIFGHDDIKTGVIPIKNGSGSLKLPQLVSPGATIVRIGDIEFGVIS